MTKTATTPKTPVPPKAPKLAGVPALPNTRKRDAGKKAAATKAAKVAAAKPPVLPRAAKEVDPKTLTDTETRKRLAAVYKLEKAVEVKAATHAAAKKAAKAAKAALTEAEEALEQEIRDQRFGPGPLFNSTGDGKAGDERKVAGE